MKGGGDGADRGAGVEAAVAGAQGEAPGARGALEEGESASGESAVELVRVAEQDGAEAEPGGGEGAVEVVHEGNCTVVVRALVKAFFALVRTGPGGFSWDIQVFPGG